MKGLRISSNLTLPLDFVTKTCGILAQRRKGKTYTASVLAEELVAAKVPIVVLDPTGAWWGLRASADGKGPGLPVVIFGGQHGDVPLERTAGRFVADLVTDEPGFYVIDFSLFESNEAERQFATDFAERLYRAKGKPGMDFPLHLIVDEADRFIPQHSPRGDQRMLGAFEAIVRRGGLRGLGTTLISQRAAVVNKNVLEQVDSLILLRTVGPNDRKAVEGYVSSHGTDVEKAELLGSLSSLELGEAWVWEPGAQPALFERVRIRERKTFNSSATPKPGERRIEPRELADVDLASLEARMKETIERTKADDPAELRKRIKELEKTVRELERRPTTTEVPVAPDPVVVEVPVLTRAEIDQLDEMWMNVAHLVEERTAGIERAINEVANPLALLLSRADQRLEQVPSVGKRAERDMPANKGRGVGAPTTPAPADRAPARSSRTVATAAAPAGEPVRSGTISGPQQKILDALAWLEEVGIAPAARLQVAMIAGYHPRTKGFTNSLGTMSSDGLISYPMPGYVAFTEDGRAHANWPALAGSDDELQEAIFRQVGNAKSRILRELIGRYPEPVSREVLAEVLDYHPRTKGFTNSLGSLKTLGLIAYPQPGFVVAESILFLGGR